MISVSASSFNSGIIFHGDVYSVSLEIKEGKAEIELSKNRISRSGRIAEFMLAKPMLRGLYSLFMMQRSALLMLPLEIIVEREARKEKSDGSKSPLIKLINYFLMAMLVSLLWHLITKLFSNVKSTGQFHGAEHKAVNAYRHTGKELTLDSCRSASRVSDSCGSIFIAFFLSVYAAVSALLKIFRSKHNSHAKFILSWLIATELFHLDSETVALKPLYKAGRFLQERFLTLEPSDAQLIAAVEAFNLLLRAETEQHETVTGVSIS